MTDLHPAIARMTDIEGEILAELGVPLDTIVAFGRECERRSLPELQPLAAVQTPTPAPLTSPSQPPPPNAQPGDQAAAGSNVAAQGWATDPAVTTWTAAVAEYANICARNSGTIPAADVAWKLRQITRQHVTAATEVQQ